MRFFINQWILYGVSKVYKRYLCGILIDVLDWHIELSELELQSRHYIHFWTNIFRKDVILESAKLWVEYYQSFLQG